MKLKLNIEVEIDAKVTKDKESITDCAILMYDVTVIEGNVIMNQIPHLMSALSSEMKKRIPIRFGDSLIIGGEIPKLKGIIDEINEDKDFPPINQISDDQITEKEY